MSNAGIIFYGVSWCWDCRRAKRFFDKHQIPYQYIDIDKNTEGEKYVIDVNKGMRSVPTIVLDDNTILVEPTVAELRDHFDIKH